MNTSALHVVFGTGQVGSQLVDRLLARGYRVRTVRRSAEASRHPMHEAVQADILDREATVSAGAGAAVVYHCANAPYHDKFINKRPRDGGPPRRDVLAHDLPPR